MEGLRGGDDTETLPAVIKCELYTLTGGGGAKTSPGACSCPLVPSHIPDTYLYLSHLVKLSLRNFCRFGDPKLLLIQYKEWNHRKNYNLGGIHFLAAPS